jgi:hypothetical protein
LLTSKEGEGRPQHHSLPRQSSNTTANVTVVRLAVVLDHQAVCHASFAAYYWSLRSTADDWLFLGTGSSDLSCLLDSLKLLAAGLLE